jgi:colanic acid biosynthesis glycosyl transferase WcaI
VTVLSDDLADNVRRKTDHPEKVHVIPNFVDTDAIRPGPSRNAYRDEFGLDGKKVVMYAGNVGLSQSLDTVIDAARSMSSNDDVVFVVNGQGATRAALEERARGLTNVRFIDLQPPERLPEVLAAGDIHLVPLRAGLASSSFPSKTYSILAAGRPLIASIDGGSEIARVVERAGAGLTVPPEDPGALADAIRRLLASPDEAAEMGRRGRDYVERFASASSVADAYEDLFRELARK